MNTASSIQKPPTPETKTNFGPLDHAINELAKHQQLRIVEKGLIEIEPSKLTELAKTAAQAGVRLEILGIKDDKVIARPATRRYEVFQQDASGKISTSVQPHNMPVMID